MEIIETGDLVRIAYERTERFVAVEAFMGIYGVGALIKDYIREVCQTSPMSRRPRYCTHVVSERLPYTGRYQSEKRWHKVVESATNWPGAL